jgi:hypothetical protein
MKLYEFTTPDGAKHSHRSMSRLTDVLVAVGTVTEKYEVVGFFSDHSSGIAALQELKEAGVAYWQNSALISLITEA